MYQTRAAAPDPDMIQQVVRRLREKLEPEPAEPHYIVTVRGRGYKLVG